MEIVEAVVGEGGVLRVENVPYEAGTRLRVTLEQEKPETTREEWSALIRECYGSMPDFEIEEFARNYPEPVGPLFLSEDRAES